MRVKPPTFLSLLSTSITFDWGGSKWKQHITPPHLLNLDKSTTMLDKLKITLAFRSDHSNRLGVFIYWQTQACMVPVVTSDSGWSLLTTVRVHTISFERIERAVLNVLRSSPLLQLRRLPKKCANILEMSSVSCVAHRGKVQHNCHWNVVWHGAFAMVTSQLSAFHALGNVHLYDNLHPTNVLRKSS